MNKTEKKRIITAGAGLAVGIINGLLGAGGGMIAVPLLNGLGLERKEAHANAVAVIMPICVLSASMYLIKGNVTIGDALPFIPGGIAGSFIGTYLMKKISPFGLKKVFGVFMIWAGIRLLLK